MFSLLSVWVGSISDVDLKASNYQDFSINNSILISIKFGTLYLVSKDKTTFVGWLKSIHLML